MRVFPGSALLQLEFDKVKELVSLQCQTPLAKEKVSQLRIHDDWDYISNALFQTHEYKILLNGGEDIPNSFSDNISREIKWLSIPGALLSADQILLLRKLAENASRIYRWFNLEKIATNPSLSKIIGESWYEGGIIEIIDDILEENGSVKDSASADLANIRTTLYQKRNALRKLFDKIVKQLQQAGHLSDIGESFMNGRRVLAVLSENKRTIKGVIHAESDTGKTSFIEPEETTGLNNEIFSLEYEEKREIERILRKLTTDLQNYESFLSQYYKISGELDFVRARARFALEIGGNLPKIVKRPVVKLFEAYHPLLFLYNRSSGKPTIPLTVNLSEENRILVISGPNAGGKTVTLKTVGLLQLMLQSGLLVPVSPDSEMGTFKQLFIHMGDTQSLEFELSTYSSHLRHMKFFLENANGKTLFFIDELGSGSDPNLGGAFAEVILEELAIKRAYGIVTTHYLNLKVMANKVKGILNGAMQFDEQKLQPLYKLQIGRPGSSYTFSIAERIGLEKSIIERARKLVNENQFELDWLLNTTEQDSQRVKKEQLKLQSLIKENEKLKKEMELVMDKERHRQQMEFLKEQNKISIEKYAYFRNLERRMKSLINVWRKADDKSEVIKSIQALLFQQHDKLQQEKRQRNFDEKFIEIGGAVKIGDKVKMRNNRSVGVVKELRGKKAILQVGQIPITVSINDVVVIKDNGSPELPQ